MILFLYGSFILIILTILDQCIELIKAKLVILFHYRITRAWAILSSSLNCFMVSEH